jgi:hypothetical protein
MFLIVRFLRHHNRSSCFICVITTDLLALLASSQQILRYLRQDNRLLRYLRQDNRFLCYLHQQNRLLRFLRHHDSLLRKLRQRISILLIGVTFNASNAINKSFPQLLASS